MNGIIDGTMPETAPQTTKTKPQMRTGLGNDATVTGHNTSDWPAGPIERIIRTDASAGVEGEILAPPHIEDYGTD